MNSLKSLISDGDGQPSMMRLGMLLVLLTLLIPKAVVAIKTGGAVNFNQDDLWVLGVVFGSKAVQSHAENSTSTKP